MEFESFVGRYVNSMHFNLYSGNSKSIALKSGPCENNLENNVKPEKLGDCLANKIKELDEQDNTTSLEEKLADLRKYASVIIYEE